VFIGVQASGLNGAVAGMALGAVLMVFIRAYALSLAATDSGVPLNRTAEQLSKSHHAQHSHWDSFTSRLKHEWPLIRHFALPAALLGLAVQPFEWFVRLMMANAHDGFSELGIFTSAYALSQAVQFIPQQLGQSALPVLTKELQMPDRASARRLTHQLTILFTACACAVAIAMMLLAGPLMRLYGEHFGNGAAALAVMTVAYVFASSARISSLVLVASGQMWRQTTHSLIWGAVLVGAFWLAPKKNAATLAVCYVLTFIVFRVLQANSARKTLAANCTSETKAP
jgi:O-antigen/teichoic acid export membrane protein